MRLCTTTLTVEALYISESSTYNFEVEPLHLGLIILQTK